MIITHAYTPIVLVAVAVVVCSLKPNKQPNNEQPNEHKTNESPAEQKDDLERREHLCYETKSKHDNYISAISSHAGSFENIASAVHASRE